MRPARPNRSKAATLQGWLSFAYPARGVVGNPRKNPRDVAQPYDVREEQIRAMTQGVYESSVKSELGVKGDFCDADDVRLDVKSGLYRNSEKIRNLVSRAFAITKSNAKKFGYVDPETGALTQRSIAESYKRYNENVDHLMINRQDYEETLALARKSFYRVTFEPTAAGFKFFVWPMRPGQSIPERYNSQEEAEKVVDTANGRHDPRQTGIWWSPPEDPYTRQDLKHWLPPDKYFSMAWSNGGKHG